MTKKISMLLALIIGALSIMVIAVWTTTGESNNPIPISEVVILNYDALSEDGEKLLDISNLNMEEPYLIIKYQINPSKADDTKLRVFADSENVHMLLDTFTFEIYITTATLSGLNTITITLKDDKTNKQDLIILMVKMPDEVEVPDL